MPRRSALLVTWFLLAMALAWPVRADPAVAQVFAIHASKALRAGDKRGAIALLEKAYSADPSADYLERTADLYEELFREQGDLSDLRLAVLNYTRSLAAETNAVEASEIQGRLKRLRQQLRDLAPGPEPEPPPVPSRPASVTVEFLAKPGAGPIHISIGGQTCDAPCTLRLAPGPYAVTASGGDDLRLSLLVPAASGTVHLPSSARPYLVPGVALTVAGALVAASLWSFRFACTPNLDLTLTPCETTNLAVWPIVGGAMFFTGVGFLGYYGSHIPHDAVVQVDEGHHADGAPSESGWQLVSAGVMPLRSGAAAGVGFSF
jgi:hypothetical protein